MISKEFGGKIEKKPEKKPMNDAHEILHAADAGDLTRIRELLARDPALVSARGEHRVTPLHCAAEHNHPEVVAALLDAGADLEAETDWGMTPLEWAANMGGEAAAGLLLERGAKLNIWSAAALGRLDDVKSFVASPGALKPGAAQKRHRQNPDGSWSALPAPEDFTGAISDALYIACRNGKAEVAAYLLDLGANINQRGFFGGAGLHWAACNGHKETVEMLLARGADKELRDEQFHYTPREWAAEFHHEEIAELLR